MAAILGGALSLSGFLLQTFFENPIAGPFVLGISSGAKMVVALTMIYYLGRAVNVTSYTSVSYTHLHSYRLEIPLLTGTLSYLSDRAFTAALPQLFQNILKEEHIEENK